jgi:threonine dehydrogenase-like Zn-dependent dehydrogenase
MKAIVLSTGSSDLRLANRAEPTITSPNEVKVRVLRVGICGTDREEASGGRARSPGGQSDLIIGHEMLGQVVAVGDAVTRVQPDDYAVFTVRRGCDNCLSCAMNRPDMCRTGEYRERGIWGLDGYQTEFVVDKEQYVVRIPPELEPVGVLSEPLSVAEKAIDEAVRLQFARLPDALATPHWLHGRRSLVAGLGPIGLLAAMALRLRGAEVFGLDIVDPNTARPRWLERIGGRYVDGRQVPPDRVDDVLGPMDLIFEAAGKVSQIPGAELIRQLVLHNQVMLGSVNAARDHFQMAVDDLAHAHLLWGDHIARLITHRYPYPDFETALGEHPPDEIKAVVEW